MTQVVSQRTLAALLVEHGVTDPIIDLAPKHAGASLLGLRVPGKRALACWQALRAIVPATRHWPVMVGNTTKPADLPCIAPESEVASYLQDAEAEYAELRASNPDDSSTAPDIGAAISPLVDGSWRTLGELIDAMAYAPAARRPAPPKRSPNPVSSSASSAAQLHIPEATMVSIALVPTEHGWQAPAYLPVGWEYVSPSQVACRLRRLEDLFGAELTGMTFEHIELTVARPPDNDEAAQMMSTLLMNADEGRDLEALVGAKFVSLWWD